MLQICVSKRAGYSDAITYPFHLPMPGQCLIAVLFISRLSAIGKMQADNRRGIGSYPANPGALVILVEGYNGDML